MNEDGVRVLLGASLRRLVDPGDLGEDHSLLIVGFRGSVRSLLQELGRRFAGLREEILDAAGEPESHLMVVVNKCLLGGRGSLEMGLDAGDAVEVYLVAAGG